MRQKYKIGLMWFRRDLRVEDNAALHHALKSCAKVFCLFVFDRSILDALPCADRRVEFLRESLVDLDRQLGDAAKQHGVAGAGLIVRHGDAADCLWAVASELVQRPCRRAAARLATMKPCPKNTRLA